MGKGATVEHNDENNRVMDYLMCRAIFASRAIYSQDSKFELGTRVLTRFWQIFTSKTTRHTDGLYKRFPLSILIL